MTREKAAPRARFEVVLNGIVQGVGFRPRVCLLARQAGLSGWVRNGPEGVRLQAQGARADLEHLVEMLRALPPPARVTQVRVRELSWQEEPGEFRIVPSEEGGPPRLVLLPDLVTCDSCRDEVLDPSQRRHRYPFASCALCGPRYSILRSLPWDRERTTMDRFPLCVACRAEYEDHGDRRFHAQTIACPACGPRLALRERSGALRADGEAALVRASRALAEGAILALKGLGGYQLVADAADAATLQRLRARKRRPDKPLALMARDLEEARSLIEIGPLEERALLSASGPIVLAPRRSKAAVAEEVAPGVAWLGVMLPTTPLHHLLLRDLGRPLVATSGNLSGEPIFFRDEDARRGLGEVADLFVDHDREILQVVDDSVVRVIDGAVVTLRCARGLAPRHFETQEELPSLLATGSDIKGALAFSRGREVVLGPHLGDLETVRAQEAARHQIQVLPRLLGAVPAGVVCDAHPDWSSARLALREEPDAARVLHHEAHLWSCLLENRTKPPVLGVCWDGTGYGGDGTVRGGEFLHLDAAGECRRVTHLRTFSLLGGEAAVREPRRLALALMLEAGMARRIDPSEPALASFRRSEIALLRRVHERGLNAPRTSSAGRLFDGVAAFLGLRGRTSYEGQAAMELESVAERAERAALRPAPPLPDLALGPDGLDWEPCLHALLERRDGGEEPGTLAIAFHEALARGIAAAAGHAGCERVALTGGCFQNARLSRLAREELERGGHRVLRHRDLPANDGGLAAGQILAALPRSRGLGG